jgi:predicted nucleic-acid-binding Zn-ribbon protein
MEEIMKVASTEKGYYNLLKKDEKYRKIVSDWVRVHVDTRSVTDPEHRAYFIKDCLKKAYTEWYKQIDISSYLNTN